MKFSVKSFAVVAVATAAVGVSAGCGSSSDSAGSSSSASSQVAVSSSPSASVSASQVPAGQPNYDSLTFDSISKALKCVVPVNRKYSDPEYRVEDGGPVEDSLDCFPENAYKNHNETGFIRVVKFKSSDAAALALKNNWNSNGDGYGKGDKQGNQQVFGPWMIVSDPINTQATALAMFRAAGGTVGTSVTSGDPEFGAVTISQIWSKLGCSGKLGMVKIPLYNESPLSNGLYSCSWVVKSDDTLKSHGVVIVDTNSILDAVKVASDHTESDVTELPMTGTSVGHWAIYGVDFPAVKSAAAAVRSLGKK